MSSRTVAVIQARTGSTRFPRKVLELLGDRAILSHVVRRVALAKRVDEVVVATTDLDEDRAVQLLCHEEGVRCILGPAHDVLTRYRLATIESQADVVVRITADCPLISPLLIDEVVDARMSRDTDYASNTLRRTYPHGLDVETLTSRALMIAADRATSTYDREHVTPFIYGRPNEFTLHSCEGSTDWSWLRWTVDYPDDLDFLRLLTVELPECLRADSDWQAIAKSVAGKPSIVEALGRLHAKQTTNTMSMPHASSALRTTGG